MYTKCGIYMVAQSQLHGWRQNTNATYLQRSGRPCFGAELQKRTSVPFVLAYVKEWDVIKEGQVDAGGTKIDGKQIAAGWDTKEE